MMNLSVLLRTADGFLQAGTVLYSTTKNTVSYLSHYISPCTVNCAFACELYLKYLYYMGQGKDGEELKKHYLNEIFEVLSPQVQSEIKKEYEKWTSLLSLDDCLQKHKRVFLDFRYMYEGKEDVEYEVVPGSLYNLMISLHNVCYAKKEATKDAH